MSVEIRKVDTTIHETGTADRVDTDYVLGAEIDGVFVPFASRPATDVEAYIETHRDSTDTSSTSSASTSATDGGEGGNGGNSETTQ